VSRDLIVASLTELQQATSIRAGAVPDKRFLRNETRV
jgi:hypothetical protein